MLFNKLKHTHRYAIIWLTLLMVVPVSALAHTFHTSLMRLEYNEKEKLGEITLQLFAQDLITALNQSKDGGRVNLEKDKDIPARVLAYLESNFVLKDASGATAKLTWVGLENQGDLVVLYLETPLPRGLADMQLRNTILFDVADSQVNLVNVVMPAGKTALSYERGDTSFKAINLPVPAVNP